jgi:hypothetical protein
MDLSTLSPPTPVPPSDPPSAPTPPGSLGIKERRTWRTSQVVLFCTLALLLGMRIGYSGEKAPAASSRGAVPGQSGLPPAPTTPTTLAPGDPGQPTDTSPTTGSATTGTREPVGAAQGTPEVLLEVSPRTGPLTTDTFTVAAGGWKVGWSFNCRGQGGSGPFNVTVRHPGSGEAPEDPPVQQNGPDGKGIEQFSSQGDHVLVVQTNCLWALKVTGIPG